ncbi:universal stress protein [Nocardioides campestrisoli]|uniref:universal stress protein n=1 Tax=Nocardioides campestrisoli TaxID=2736757 RepID=UPI0015E73262|nr:universal stress protein [Nocardioides campestrisoli]
MKAMPGSVLVGVTGRGENTQALRFALEEARRLGTGVTLVHAVAPAPPTPPGAVLVTFEDDWTELGRTIVAEVAAEAEELAGDVPVSSVVGYGAAGALLSDLSRDAVRVVLQHQHVHRMVRLVTGSTSARVAAQAHCPVISVPAGHEAEPESSGDVVAGVHDDGGPAEVVKAAVAEAELHGWRTRLLHAWHLPGAYDDLLEPEGAWARAALENLRHSSQDHAGADLEVEVVHEWPADALVERSKTASLVVVGRHGRRGPISPRLGSRARAVLANSHCPVMVVPLASESTERRSD